MPPGRAFPLVFPPAGGLPPVADLPPAAGFTFAPVIPGFSEVSAFRVVCGEGFAGRRAFFD